MKNLKQVFPIVAAASVLVLASTGAIAAPATDLPVEALAFMADIKTYATSLMRDFWPLALIILGGFTAFKLVRKGVNKAT